MIGQNDGITRAVRGLEAMWYVSRCIATGPDAVSFDWRRPGTAALRYPYGIG